MMDRTFRSLFAVLALSTIILLWFRFSGTGLPEKMAVSFHDVSVPEGLDKHSKEFDKPEVVKVTDGVYVAIGFALANVVMLEGPSGLVIVDVTESVEAAAEVFEAFRKVTNKPVKAIIYTHDHADHVLGTHAFLDEGPDVPEIWAHHTMLGQFRKSMGVAAESTFRRAARQFGILLNTDLVNAGIGPQLRIGSQSRGFVPPNRLMYKDREVVSVAGMEIELVYIPGETANQIGVWIESQKVLLCADDVYKAFPNLYAIRGTPTRDVQVWANSLEKMRNLGASFLVPSHTRPISGKAEIAELLLLYHDAVQFIHDQTVRYMNKGFTPDEIVNRIFFPSRLQNHPFLQQFYGTIPWSVRGVFNTYLGLFSGDPVDLHPLPPRDRAQRLISLGGGVSNVLDTATKALKGEDWQWALELSSAVVALEPSNRRARALKIDALKMAASTQTSSCGRNYYMTSALEEARQVTTAPSRERVNEMIRVSTLERIFQGMSLMLKAEECSEQNVQVSFQFDDVNTTVCVHMRHGIAVVRMEDCAQPSISVVTTRTVWIQVLTKEVSALNAYTSGEITIHGGVLAFRSFIGCFETR